MSELGLLLLFTVIALLWHDGRRVQETAIARVRQACASAGLQFLDDVAPISRFKLSRDANGALRWRRIYTFDYTTLQGERRTGSIVMLGRTPVALQLENRTILENRGETKDGI